MLKKIPLIFPSQHVAQAVLAEFRKTYRVALRGAVVTGPDYHGGYSAHLPLGGTGFSPAEAAGAMRAIYRGFTPDRLTPSTDTPAGEANHE